MRTSILSTYEIPVKWAKHRALISTYICSSMVKFDTEWLFSGNTYFACLEYYL